VLGYCMLHRINSQQIDTVFRRADAAQTPSSSLREPRNPRLFMPARGIIRVPCLGTIRGYCAEGSEPLNDVRNHHRAPTPRSLARGGCRYLG
jgi:hypothetical protein